MVTALPMLPGATDSAATAINDSGVIVGTVRTSDARTHAVRWNAAGAATDLGTLPGDDVSFAFEINDAGVAVGYSELFSAWRDRAVRWAANGTITNLGLLPGGTYSYANGINSSGAIFGSADAADGEPHAVLWPAS